MELGWDGNHGIGRDGCFVSREIFFSIFFRPCTTRRFYGRVRRSLSDPDREDGYVDVRVRSCRIGSLVRWVRRKKARRLVNICGAP